jgi:hypothetical protein
MQVRAGLCRGHPGLRGGQLPEDGRDAAGQVPALNSRDVRVVNYSRECDLPLFPAPDVDDAVWQWLKNKLTDPAQLERGL